MTTLFWHPTGPKLSYNPAGILLIEDLNPQVAISWRVRRWPLFKIGLRCMWVAIVGGKPDDPIRPITTDSAVT